MARKSRKNMTAVMSMEEGGLTAQTTEKLECEVKAYRAAIYARLSYETEANRERDTVDTQIAYLKNFIDGRRIWNWRISMQMFLSAEQILNAQSLSA